MTTRKTIVMLTVAAIVGVLVIGFLTPAGVANTRDGRSIDAKVDPVDHLTRLKIDMFELFCSHSQLALFDLDQLTNDQPATAQVLERLGKLGHARLQLRYDNTVDLLEETTIESGTMIPLVGSVVVSDGGVRTSSISYQPVGFRAQISGAWLDDLDPMQAEVSMEIGYSGQSDRVKVAEDTYAPILAQPMITREVRVLHSRESIWFACSQPNLAGDAETMTRIMLVRVTATRLTD